MPEFNKTPEDYGVTSKVRIALKVHAETENLLSGIKVGTEKGTVHLMGKVPTAKDKDSVERIARTVPDVVSLKNELEVG